MEQIDRVKVEFYNKSKLYVIGTNDKNQKVFVMLFRHGCQYSLPNFDNGDEIVVVYKSQACKYNKEKQSWSITAREVYTLADYEEIIKRREETKKAYEELMKRREEEEKREEVKRNLQKEIWKMESEINKRYNARFRPIIKKAESYRWTFSEALEKVSLLQASDKEVVTSVLSSVLDDSFRLLDVIIEESGRYFFKPLSNSGYKDYRDFDWVFYYTVRIQHIETGYIEELLVKKFEGDTVVRIEYVDSYYTGGDDDDRGWKRGFLKETDILTPVSLQTNVILYLQSGKTHKETVSYTKKQLEEFCHSHEIEFSEPVI